MIREKLVCLMEKTTTRPSSCTKEPRSDLHKVLGKGRFVNQAHRGLIEGDVLESVGDHERLVVASKLSRTKFGFSDENGKSLPQSTEYKIMQELGYVLRELSYSMKQDLERVRKHRTQWRESIMLQAQTFSQFEDGDGRHPRG